VVLVSSSSGVKSAAGADLDGELPLVTTFDELLDAYGKVAAA
jgi:hypothetical protein